MCANLADRNGTGGVLELAVQVVGELGDLVKSVRHVLGAGTGGRRRRGNDGAGGRQDGSESGKLELHFERVGERRWSGSCRK